MFNVFQQNRLRLFVTGPAFLFRVGLVILASARPFLEAALDRSALISTLARLPAAALPADPDALISNALSVKIRDDDVRKQRSKVEATLKRQTAQQRTQSQRRQFHVSHCLLGFS